MNHTNVQMVAILPTATAKQTSSLIENEIVGKGLIICISYIITT